MIIYVVLLGLICLYGLLLCLYPRNKQAKRVFLFLAFFSCILVLGLRADTVGEDTRHYILVFNESKNVGLKSILTSTNFRTPYYTDEYGYTDTIENGFLLWCKFIHLFTNNPQIYIFINSAFICTLFAVFIYDNCEKVFFPTLIFLCESMFMLSFNGQRQIMAAAVALQAYTLLRKRRIKSSIIVLFLAALIHNVALVCLCFIPIMLVKPKDEKKTFKIAIILTVASPMIILAFQNVVIRFFPRYKYYFSINYWQNSIGGAFILNILELLAVFIMYFLDFRVAGSAKAAVFTLAYIVCEFTGFEITMFSRVGWFFRGFLILFFPLFTQYFKGRNKQYIRWGIEFILILFYFSYASSPARTYSFFWN